MTPSELEAALLLQIRAAGLPEPVTEYRAVPGRQYRWDGAYLDARILYEVQGGIWRKGGHSTGGGITRDCEKNNLAVLRNFRTLFFTREMIEDGRAVLYLRAALCL
ncbi:MAG: hypothetical protein WC683_08155 [bacterium]